MGKLGGEFSNFSPKRVARKKRIGNKSKVDLLVRTATGGLIKGFNTRSWDMELGIVTGGLVLEE